MPEFTDYAPGTPSWIDLQTSDPAKAAEFYRTLFGWERQDLGPEAGGYGFFLKDGKMVAGVGPKMGEAPTAWSTYVSVADADATIAKVKQNGGTVVVEPMDVMTAGRMAVFIDPTGAFIGVWQPRDHKGSQLANEIGTWGWSELQTRDLEKAKAFYSAVFGWKPTQFEGMAEYTVLENDGRGIGGAMPMPAEVPKEVPSNWLTYFGVDDTDATVERAKQNGGGVLAPPMEIPNVGRFAVLTDPQGGVFAVIKTQPPSEN
jgi:uncharacterized protein